MLEKTLRNGISFGLLTSSGRVVPRHLPQVGMVLDCAGVSFRGRLREPTLSVSPNARSVRDVARAEGPGGGTRTFGAEELPRDVECLAADDDDLLAAEELLGNNAGETAQKVSLAVDDNLSASNGR